MFTRSIASQTDTKGLGRRDLTHCTSKFHIGRNWVIFGDFSQIGSRDMLRGQCFVGRIGPWEATLKPLNRLLVHPEVNQARKAKGPKTVPNTV